MLHLTVSKRKFEFHSKINDHVYGERVNKIVVFINHV